MSEEAGSSQSRTTLYEILGLLNPPFAFGNHEQNNGPTTEQIKAAYRRALLLHHPDRQQSEQSTRPIDSAIKSPQLQKAGCVGKPSVDDIRNAYDVLVNAAARREYDRSLALGLASAGKSPEIAGQARSDNAGLEVTDLEDMDLQEDVPVWTRRCRCGEAKGFAVSEEQLLAEMIKADGDITSNREDRQVGHSGEIVLACSGCSLCIRVSFAIAAE
ncbi:MAG: Diphthamide biosynthesis protein 4 [Alyxoria varia]|nr:MAG: Diphthamide biosynthesis protein 4 [Alyxoria varia]